MKKLFKYSLCNVNWNITDTHRPLFQDKVVWDAFVVEKTTGNELAQFTPQRITGITMEFSINVSQLPVKDINAGQNYNYCLVEIDDEISGYFIINYDINSSGNITYSLRLDSVSSYMWRLSFAGKSAYVERQHTDRYINAKFPGTEEYKFNYKQFSPIHNQDSFTQSYRPSANVYRAPLKLDSPDVSNFAYEGFKTNKGYDNVFSFYNEAESNQRMYTYAVIVSSKETESESKTPIIAIAPLTMISEEAQMAIVKVAGDATNRAMPNFTMANNYQSLISATIIDSETSNPVLRSDNLILPFVKKIIVTDFPIWSGSDTLAEFTLDKGAKNGGNHIGVIPISRGNGLTTQTIPFYSIKSKVNYDLSAITESITDAISNVTIGGLNHLVDPKVFSQEFLEIDIESSSGQTYNLKQNSLFMENIYDVDFDYYCATDCNETYGYLKLERKSIYSNVKIYQNYSYLESGLITSTPNALPISNDAWSTFIVNSGASYATAKANTKRNYKTATGNQFINGGAGLLKDVVLGGELGGGVPGAIAGGLFGAAQIGLHAFTQHRSLKLNRDNQLRQLSAQEADLSRQPETVNFQGFSGTMLSILTMNHFNITDTPLANYGNYYVYAKSLVGQRLSQLDNHFFKNGYVVNANFPIKDITFFKTRKIFNFWKISNLMDAVDKSNGIGQVVYNDIKDIFSNGITLWHSIININNYDIGNKELWMGENNVKIKRKNVNDNKTIQSIDKDKAQR